MARRLPVQCFLFEGEMLPIEEIARRVPLFQVRTLVKHLLAGRNSRQLILSFDHPARRSANARRGAVAYRRAKRVEVTREKD